MSHQACTWAVTQQMTTDSGARHVLLVMANYASVTGKNVWLSSERIAKETGLSVRTVKYKLDELERIGLIKPGNQKILDAEGFRPDRRPNIFDLNLGHGVQQLHVAEPRGANDDSHGVQMTTERGAPAAPYKVLNRDLEKVERDTSVKRKTKSGAKLTLAQYATANPDANWGPEDGKARKHLRDSKMPEEWFFLAIRWFRDRYMDSTEHKYINWPAAFANSVVDNWGKLWYFDQKSQTWALSSQGMAYKIKVDGGAQ